MIEYLLRLFLLVPLIGGLAWGSLWLWRKAQLGLPRSAAREHGLTIVDAATLGTNGKIVVVAYRGHEYLLAASRGGIVCLSEVGGDDA